MKRWLSAVGVALVMATATVAVAEPERRGPDARHHDRSPADLRTRILKERVGLDDGKAAAVETVLRRALEERKAGRERLREARRELHALLEGDSDDQKAYAKALGALRKAQADLQAARNRELDALAKILTPKQQAKLAAAVHEAKRGTRGRKHDEGRPGRRGHRGSPRN